MVDINDAAVTELVDHAQLEQGVPAYLRTLRLGLRDLVDLQCLREILQP